MTNLLTYKNYHASVQFSTDDSVFFGKINGISDLISFEGTSVDELKEAFENAVDDYIELCEITGKNPEKSYKGSFNIRIKPILHKRLSHKAFELGISLNQLVEQAITEKLEPK